MYFFETTLRVRYAETDQMGFAYYGSYAQYYEVGRVELLINNPHLNCSSHGISLLYIEPS